VSSITLYLSDFQQCQLNCRRCALKDDPQQQHVLVSPPQPSYTPSSNSSSSSGCCCRCWGVSRSWRCRCMLPRLVTSRCNVVYSYPFSSGPRRSVTCWQFDGFSLRMYVCMSVFVCVREFVSIKSHGMYLKLLFRFHAPVGVTRGLADRSDYIVTRRHRGHILVRCLSRDHARGGWDVRRSGLPCTHPLWSEAAAAEYRRFHKSCSENLAGQTIIQVVRCCNAAKPPRHRSTWIRGACRACYSMTSHAMC
jgi:hypothetical protein